MQVKSSFPGFLLNSPTLIDLDGNGSNLEIIIGTSGGHIHVLNSDGSSRVGFPVTTDSVHGQVFIKFPELLPICLMSDLVTGNNTCDFIF